MGALIRIRGEGALIGIGALIDKNTFDWGGGGGGALIQKGALNRFVTVVERTMEPLLSGQSAISSGKWQVTA